MDRSKMTCFNSKMVKMAVFFILMTLFLLLVSFGEFTQVKYVNLRDLEIERYVCEGEGTGTDIRLQKDDGYSATGGKSKYVDLGRPDDEGDASCRGECERVKPYPGLCVVQGSTKENQVVNDIHCLPSLLIVGVMKGGTGEMMKRLNEHPMLQSGKGDDNANEVHFFTDKVDDANSGSSSQRCSWLSYARHFSVSPPAAPENGKALVPISFDKSPDYIRSPAALKKMRDMLPTIKLVVLLRDPVRRAISAFNHHCRHGRYWSIQNRVPPNRRMAKSFKAKQVFLILRPGGIGAMEDNDEIRRSDVLRIEWLLKQTKAGTLIGCDRDADASTCKTLREGDIPNYFGRLHYPCSAERYKDYVKAALPVEHGGNLGVAGYENSESRREVVSGAGEELSFGFYKSQIATLLETFPSPKPSVDGSHSQVKVIFQESMWGNTLGAVNQVVQWMGLTPLGALQKTSSRSPSSESSSVLASTFKEDYPELYSGLQGFYAQRNEGLLPLLRERGLISGSGPEQAPAWVH